MAHIGISRVKEKLKYFFYFTMTILAIVNVMFFICNWADIKPQLNNESILLSVVGFFFAFAGINIYSIFNTNIESEKEALRDLVERYDGELKMSSKMLQFPQELIMIWQTCQYLATSQTVQNRAFDSISDLKKRLEGQKEFVKDLKANHRIIQFERYSEDLANLAQGVMSTLKQHQVAIDGNDNFFRPIHGNEDNYKKRMADVISLAESIVSCSYEPEFSEKKKLSFFGKLKDIVSYSKTIFRA